MKIAITMPGNTGDCIYALPTARVLCAAHHTTCDFYTAHTSQHVRKLFEYQPYIDQLIIPDDYVVQRRDNGTQPWQMPVHGEYAAVYHLGYRQTPDKALHQYIGQQVGITMAMAVGYSYPELPIIDWNGAPAVVLPNKLGHEERVHLPYICVAPRHPTDFDNLFYNLTIEMRQRGINVVQIGGKNEYVGVGRDATDIDFLETVSILSRSSGFIGMMASQLVLANGFDIPKIAPYDGKSWDMRHVIQTHRNHYLVHPTVEQILALL